MICAHTLWDSELNQHHFVCYNTLRPHSESNVRSESSVCTIAILVFNINCTFISQWFALQISNTQLFLVLRWYFKFIGLCRPRLLKNKWHKWNMLGSYALLDFMCATLFVLLSDMLRFERRYESQLYSLDFNRKVWDVTILSQYAAGVMISTHPQ